MIRTDPLGPIHPAEHLREDFLDELGMSHEAAAEALHVSLSQLTPFLAEEAPLTGELALRLERAFGCTADYWMRWQKQYELDCARRSASVDLSSIILVNPAALAAE